MKEIVFLLEEPSARELLRGLWPRLVPETSGVWPRYIVFEGKQDLDNELERKLRGYANPEAQFIVLRDQDGGDCFQIKRELASRCVRAGKARSLIRIACHELESFYLGDLAAVELALNIKGLSRRQREQKYRSPDAIVRPSMELRRLTRDKYQKVSGSRSIAGHLNLERSGSTSFRHLVNAIERARDDLQSTAR